MKGLSCLTSLLFELQKLPGIGPRSAARLAQYFLKAKTEDIRQLANNMLDLKSKVTTCIQCFNFTQDSTLCAFCVDSSRNSDLLCVVEQAFDVFRIESCGTFKGYYHVLQGAISPLNHVYPKDLTFDKLHERVQNGKVKELILAIDSDIEGDTTALYIMKNFKSMNLKISRLAQGIPFGSDLSFVDDKTLSQAIEHRTLF